MPKIIPLRVMLLVLVLTACNPVKNLENTESAISKWQELYNAQEAEALYALSGEALRETTALKDIEDQLTIMTARLGKATSSERLDWRVMNVNGVNQTVVTMQTVFELGEGVETFVLQENEEGEMKIVTWTVQSENLQLTPADVSGRSQ